MKLSPGALQALSVMLRAFIEEKLGPKFIESRSIPFEKSFEESSPTTPTFFILSPGVDPLKVNMISATTPRKANKFETNSTQVSVLLRTANYLSEKLNFNQMYIPYYNEAGPQKRLMFKINQGQFKDKFVKYQLMF